ncbi:hypothetical protein DSO57_1034009 [Entomophthora muscae]|uniref:Uncharacterized protein n=1 Tax=Entomophthora muscae TaxID=34485 RepID=A0ACC2RES1_9FUNG|nr:hypothetical protein DSO57_1034009 [Entomophthora muscae]
MQFETMKIENLVNASDGNIVKLKNNFVKYENHLKPVLKKNMTSLCKEEVTGTSATLPEIDKIQCQLESLAIFNNIKFPEICEESVKQEKQGSILMVEIQDL